MDIVEQLRNWTADDVLVHATDLMADAADEIERLRRFRDEAIADEGR